ncbi:uncharacterized protein LOC108511419 [Phoenix dactylifera]|uniref:Uncharacterized protein LOC108511419 n=1 Tax=Phoenix dactylifera TaxID=42345 RepID=A0A8B9AJW2_PHODC|nr:uncharacterized protein LOC108511419 [Phoenix dactylifera]
MEGTELRRSMTLSEQLAVEDSPNPPTAPTGVAEKREAFAAESGPGSVSHWNLMDIIKEEHDVNGGAGAGINWKSLKERLRLHRTGAGAVWATPSGHPCPISDPEVVVSVRPNPAATLGRSISRSVSIRNAEITFRGSASRRGAIVSDYNPPAAAARGTAEEEDSPASGGSRGGEEELEGCEGSNRSGAGEAEAAAAEQPVTISLMALLEQTDRWGGEGEEASAAEEEEVAEDGEGDVGGMYYVCCVCMVRHKGAAFIPCGHTFCRLCSRELWVSGGNCPLCNGFIFEILDIF